MIEVCIDTSKEAFHEHPHHELSRIFRALANSLAHFPLKESPLVDINGNTCGRYRELEDDHPSELERRASSYALGFTDGLGWALVHLAELGELRNELLRTDDIEIVARIADAATDLYREDGADPAAWAQGGTIERVADIDAGRPA